MTLQGGSPTHMIQTSIDSVAKATVGLSSSSFSSAWVGFVLGGIDRGCLSLSNFSVHEVTYKIISPTHAACIALPVTDFNSRVDIDASSSAGMSPPRLPAEILSFARTGKPMGPKCSNGWNTRSLTAWIIDVCKRAGTGCNTLPIKDA